MQNNNPDSVALVSSPETVASLAEIALLADRELVERIGRLVGCERRATACLVAHLAEMDRRRLHLGLGYSSLFTYCTQALHLSEQAAYKRIEAARAARSFPDLSARLADGSLHLSAVVLLAPVLTRENQAALIAEARHKTKRRLEEIVARIRPAGPVPALVRKLPVSPQTVSAGAAAGPDLRGAPAAAAAPAPPAPAAPAASAVAAFPAVRADSASIAVPDPPSPARPIVAPLAPDRFRVQFTASAEMHARLRRAQALLRHKVPDGDIAQILDLALIALLEKTEARKFGRRKSDRRRSAPGSPAVAPVRPSPETPRPTSRRRASTRSRYIPAEVRRTVWERDQGRCTFTGADGVRCSETGFLEFDHREPFACGGPATVDNISLSCRQHNLHLARLRFGSSCGRVREESPSYLGFRPSTLRWRRAREEAYNSPRG